MSSTDGWHHQYFTDAAQAASADSLRCLVTVLVLAPTKLSLVIFEEAFLFCCVVVGGPVATDAASFD